MSVKRSEISIVTVPTRPLVRYHGGKWKLAKWIIANMPQHRTYVEPFGGGASVLLRKPRSYAEVYNDLDGEMVNLFRVVRDQGEELRRRLELTPFSRSEYMAARSSDADVIKVARKTIIRSFMGFGSDSINHNSGFRANNNRSGTTPAHDWKKYPMVLSAIIARLQGVVIECRDAIEVMTQQDGIDTLHYVDPPYLHSTRTNTRKNSYKYELIDEDHTNLLMFLQRLTGKVLLSGYDNTMYHDMLTGWKCVKRNTYADGARQRTEILWINPLAADCLER